MSGCLSALLPLPLPLSCGKAAGPARLALHASALSVLSARSAPSQCCSTAARSGTSSSHSRTSPSTPRWAGRGVVHIDDVRSVHPMCTNARGHAAASVIGRRVGGMRRCMGRPTWLSRSQACRSPTCLRRAHTSLPPLQAPPCAQGNIGKLSRPGRSHISCACGALNKVGTVGGGEGGRQGRAQQSRARCQPARPAVFCGQRDECCVGLAPWGGSRKCRATGQRRRALWQLL